jgi:osmoprotectant transport system substrate-binding protein
MFTRHRGAQAGIAAAALIALPILAACSDSDKSTTSPPASTSPGASTSATTTGCTPIADTNLVVLADDKQSQASDNIIPAVNKSLAQAPLTDALNEVSKALDQDALTGLNRATGSEGKQPQAAAEAFVSDKKLGEGLSGGSGKVVIGTQTFAESETLGYVYKTVLDKAGYSASVQQVGSRDLLEPALEKGEIGVVPEYAASLNSFLAKKQKVTDDSSADITVTEQALKTKAEKAGIVVLTPATATDQNAFAVTKKTSDKYGLTSMSDVASKCGTTGITFGAGANCPQNVFCADAIKAKYGITIDLKPLDYDGALTRNALKQGRILIGEVFSSDADLIKAGS